MGNNAPEIGKNALELGDNALEMGKQKNNLLWPEEEQVNLLWSLQQ